MTRKDDWCQRGKCGNGGIQCMRDHYHDWCWKKYWCMLQGNEVHVKKDMFQDHTQSRYFVCYFSTEATHNVCRMQNVEIDM